jgi:RNA polymerase sigma-70 factor (ECF subfamily)
MLASMKRPEDEALEAENALVERARAGDRAAFDELVRGHLSHVWGVVWRILRHQEDTEDVVQEVFLAAHQALGSYRGASRFSTWLHRIAVNRALNYRSLAAERMRRASEPLEEAAAGVGAGTAENPAGLHLASSRTPFRELEMKELKRRLADCLEKIPAAWRAILALRIDQALSYEEIAEAVGTALGTVRSRLARARLALRRCVEGEA